MCNGRDPLKRGDTRLHGCLEEFRQQAVDSQYLLAPRIPADNLLSIKRRLIRFAYVAVSTFIPGYTDGMKTAISLPDDTFDRASRRARDLGMSRSEFFTRAAKRYLDELEVESVTEQINRAIASIAGDDSATDAVAKGHALLASDSSNW